MALGWLDRYRETPWAPIFIVVTTTLELGYAAALARRGTYWENHVQSSNQLEVRADS
jgi:hypothetical protein